MDLIEKTNSVLRKCNPSFPDPSENGSREKER